MKNTIIITVCLAIILGLSMFAFAAEVDSVKLYGNIASTTNLHDEDSYYQFDYVRAGMRAYKDNFMLRFEYDLNSTSLKWGYLEYTKPVKGWDLGFKWGLYAVPVALNYPAPTNRPLPRWGYTIDDITCAQKGGTVYAEKGIFRVDLANFGYEGYATNVKIGPINAWWTKGEGQGAFFQSSYNSWLNPFMGWTNYEDHPDRTNTIFVQNNVCFGKQIRIYMQSDFGDLGEGKSDVEFIGGINYRLFPGDNESSVGIFYDTIKKWQVRLTYGIHTIL